MAPLDPQDLDALAIHIETRVRQLTATTCENQTHTPGRGGWRGACPDCCRRDITRAIEKGMKVAFTRIKQMVMEETDE